MIYTVGEIAKQMDIAPSTLRYYDKEGLLPFLERSSGGIRMFKDEDLGWLEIIECLKKTGMPIKEIKHFIDCGMAGDETINERLSIIQSQKNVVIAKMKEMQEMLDMLDFKDWYYTKAKEAGTCAFYNAMDPEDIPQPFRKYKD